MAAVATIASTSYGRYDCSSWRGRARTSGAACSCQDQAEGIASGRRVTLMAAAAALTLLEKTKSGSAVQLRDENAKSKADSVREVLREFVSKSKAPGVLRLAFHDAGTYNASLKTGGMNGSIIYELERPENAGLERSVKVLRKAREKLELSLQVSWADLIAVAGSEAVAICGGPFIPLRLGRLDSRVTDPEGELPSEDLDAVALKLSFQRKGFSTQELIALAGAHTLGSKGFGEPTVFDNSYYSVLLNKPWTDPGNKMASMIGLPSDRALVSDEECARWLNLYKNDEALFYTDFSAAYIKLVDSTARDFLNCLPACCCLVACELVRDSCGAGKWNGHRLTPEQERMIPQTAGKWAISMDEGGTTS